MPSRTRGTATASAENSVIDSQAPLHSPAGSPNPRWSEIQSVSKPTASPALAIARMSAQRGVAPSIDPSTYGRFRPREIAIGWMLCPPDIAFEANAAGGPAGEPIDDPQA